MWSLILIRSTRSVKKAAILIRAPEVYDYLEAEGFLYAILLPKNQVLMNAWPHSSSVAPSVRAYFSNFLSSMLRTVAAKRDIS